MKGKTGKMRFAVMAAVLIPLCVVAGAAGAVKTIADMTGSFRTGAVDIDVDVYTAGDGKEAVMGEKTVVDHEGSVSYIPRIVNRGESCYIRASLEAETVEMAGSVETAERQDIMKYLYGIDDRWRYISGYLYYTETFETGDHVNICEGFHVPEDWDYMKTNELRVSVTVDAVQSRNFPADHDVDDPWGNVEITASRTCDGNTVNTVAAPEAVTAAVDGTETFGKGNGKNIRLSYINKAAGITIDHDDIFSHALFMPGDVYEGKITISTENDHEVEVMFKASCGEGPIDGSIPNNSRLDERMPDESPLTDALQLEMDNGKAFYSGSLAGRELSEYRTIAGLDAGESRDIHVKITMPEEADNAYQKKKADITWYFALAENTSDGNMDVAVKTGDDISILGSVIVCILSISAVSLLWKRRIKVKK